MKFIYKLGNLEHNIAPTKEAASKLAALLKDDGAKEIIWGPDLEVMIAPETIEDIVTLTKYYEAKNGK